MRKAIPASEYILLGESVFLSINPGVAKPTTYGTEIQKLFACLENCEFESAHAAALPVKGKTMYARPDGMMRDDSVAELRAAMLGPYNVLYRDAEKRMTIVLKTSDVSEKLRTLGTRIHLNDTQTHLQQETIRCIECEAYRAGAVMAWGLAYDWIRRWMWDDATRRASFNTELMNKQSQGAPVYPAGLTNYEEFYTINPPLGERKVLDAMRDARLLPRIYEKLVHYLGERNSYAHANNLVPSIHQTNHYIDNLLDLIGNAPFV